MHTAAIVLAIAAAVLIGLGLILAQIGLRGITPIAAAAISVPTSLLLFALATLLALALGRFPRTHSPGRRCRSSRRSGCSIRQWLRS